MQLIVLVVYSCVIIPPLSLLWHWKKISGRVLLLGLTGGIVMVVSLLAALDGAEPLVAALIGLAGAWPLVLLLLAYVVAALRRHFVRRGS